MKDRKLCRHCQMRVISQPRRLCWVCFHNLAVREQYESDNSGWAGVNENPKVLPVPTDALPGTCDKIEVLATRFEQGTRLWHPMDATYEMETANV